MKPEAAPASRRGCALPNDDFPPEFMRNAHMLAMLRAARDAHRTVCGRDALECDACRDNTQKIAQAKWALNHAIG